MKEIRFRAWNKKSNRMYFNVQNAYDMSECHNYPETCEDKDDDCEHDFLPSSFKEVLRDENYEVMQFIGLHDKNGKDIYEGDIVRYFKNVCIGEIIYYPPHYMIRDEYGDHFISEFDKNLEVIGNIYEHPELLEKDKK